MFFFQEPVESDSPLILHVQSKLSMTRDASQNSKIWRKMTPNTMSSSAKSVDHRSHHSQTYSASLNFPRKTTSGESKHTHTLPAIPDGVCFSNFLCIFIG